MIPFEELSLALAAWRVKNDLPITEQDRASLQATLGAGPPPSPEAQEYGAEAYEAEGYGAEGYGAEETENLAGADYGRDDAIVDYDRPPSDGMPPLPGTDDVTLAEAQDGMSQEMQITDSQLVSADGIEPTGAPPMPPDDIDIDMDE